MVVPSFTWPRKLIIALTLFVCLLSHVNEWNVLLFFPPSVCCCCCCLFVCPFLSFGFVVVVLFCFTAFCNFIVSTHCAVCLLRRNKLPTLAIICYVEPPLKQNYNWSVIHNHTAGMPQSISVVLIYSDSNLGNLLEKCRDVQESVNYFHKTSTCGISLAGAVISITFVATKVCLLRRNFCRNKIMFVRQNHICGSSRQ